MRLKIDIDLDNDAFVGNTASEVSRILCSVATMLHDREDLFMAGIPLYDANGNCCGSARMAY